VLQLTKRESPKKRDDRNKDQYATEDEPSPLYPIRTWRCLLR